MFVTADTVISLMHNVPLDRQYKHTVLFSSESEQAQTMANYVYHYWNDATYVNYPEGYVIVPINPGAIYDCNYIRFKNKPLSDKWFYAFVTSVEYVNPETAKINFEVDVFQTWMFDFKINSCFVEREHTNNDSIGSNILPEPLTFSIDDFECVPLPAFTDLYGYYYLVGMTKSLAGGGEAPSVQYVQGCPMAVELYRFSSKANFTNWFSSLPADYRTAVAFITMCSGDGLEEAGVSGSGVIISDTPATPSKRTVSRNVIAKNIGSYKPVNKKCYTMRYNFLRVVSNCEYADYGLEHNSGDFEFDIYYSYGSQCDMLLIPTSYMDETKTVTANNFPSVAFTSDTTGVLEQVSRRSNQMAMVNASLSSYSAGSAIVSVGSTALNNMYNDSVRAITSQNSLHNASGNFARANVNTLGAFTGYHYQLKSSSLQSLDDFFTMYGYQTNRVKKPNITGRSQFNYVKTSDCSATGSIPVGDMDVIKNAHNSGVTYWHNIENVGNYTLNNE